MHRLAELCILASGWRRVAIAFLAGALGGLAMPPLGLSFVFFLSFPVAVWLIDGALGWLEAETRAEVDAGDHTFFIADVLSLEHGPSRNALVYRESTYHSV